MVAAQHQSQDSDSKETSGRERVAAQNETKVGDDASGDDPTLVAAQPLTATDPEAEPARLQGAFEANAELRAAWHDARSYRDAFATPEAARAATGTLADLNRMDALFFSRRPEDHAQLAHAVADLVRLCSRRSLERCRSWRRVPVSHFQRSPLVRRPTLLAALNRKSRSCLADRRASNCVPRP